MQDHLSSALRDKIEILTLIQDDETGNMAWAPSRKRWGSVEIERQRNLFSIVGVGSQGATIIIRPDPLLTLHQAIRWNGEFLHLTSITLAPERDRQEIKAAICHPVTLTAKPQARTGRDTMNRPTVVQQATFSFPGILTERYFNSEGDEVFRRSTLERVLVAPKAVVLRVGDLVQLGDTAPYTVRSAWIWNSTRMNTCLNAGRMSDAVSGNRRSEGSHPDAGNHAGSHPAGSGRVL